MKQTGISFGIRKPNELAPSFPRPMASISHSVVTRRLSALLLLVVRFRYPTPAARSALAKRCPHYARPRTNPRASMKSFIDAIVIKVQLLVDYKEYGK
jgi:hypothetical protein